MSSNTHYIDGKLNRRSLRIAAVWRLFVVSRCIDEERAAQLLEAVGVCSAILVHWKGTRFYRDGKQNDKSTRTAKSMGTACFQWL